MAAAIIELDPLTDPVGATAKDDDSFLVALGRRFVFVFEGRIKVWRVGFEFGRTRVDRFEGRNDRVRFFARLADFHFGGVPNVSQLAICKTSALGLSQ